MDKEAPNHDPAPGDQPALFLLSFRQRDELAALAARGGWHVVAARRGEAADRRFRASGARIAVVDARGSASLGLDAVRAIAEADALAAQAILVCVSRNDAALLGGFYDAGATHFLVSPFGEHEFQQALRFAARGTGDGEGDTRRGGRGMLGWRYDPARGSVQPTPALAALLDSGDRMTVRAGWRHVARDERHLLKTALRRLAREPGTAFAHALAPVGRVVQHLQRDPETGRIHALIEPLGDPPDIGAVLRDAMPPVRDEQGARQWIAHALDAGSSLAVAHVALARFDVVNMAYGRGAGDQLLRAASRRIEDAVAHSLGRRAIVARLSGATYAIATREPADALARATVAIEAALARPFVVVGELVPLGARISVATSREGDDAARLLRRAAEPLASEQVDGDRLDRLAIELRAAIEGGQIETLFQPQVAIASGSIAGVEALARWQHPRLGELGAEALFASAERAGLGTALSDHVQRIALEAAATWPTALSHLRLSINVTAHDVARTGFADMLLDRIDASGFPRARLTIEITESGLIAELGRAAGLLADLRRAGCRVAIDDFGTGYSSLAYLKALPLDYLKIDRQLSQDIAGTPRDRIVVRGVIDMARSLGLAVIAEGVETDEQLELLAKEGCQYYQGFLCARPLDVTALAALIEQRA
ncbi:putative bifunctional diguanylate cyclase/phosphodiesterase [Sphingomonas baiyangensis]|uniref:EAL domain-containing protein n=1 Tax=Sphingomonas baiyangensis TaxID=2572576 RepID=A0A4U1L2H4_9SPHN|nr:GGDEF domain-containing phosphodiesterase [Sphingomonas baiyangensis]TKD51081.1 EAL domain-containing protein [Sphingomonas baiyangensis]